MAASNKRRTENTLIACKVNLLTELKIQLVTSVENLVDKVLIEASSWSEDRNNTIDYSELSHKLEKAIELMSSWCDKSETISSPASKVTIPGNRLPVQDQHVPDAERQHLVQRSEVLDEDVMNCSKKGDTRKKYEELASKLRKIDQEQFTQLSQLKDQIVSLKQEQINLKEQQQSQVETLQKSITKIDNMQKKDSKILSETNLSLKTNIKNIDKCMSEVDKISVLTGHLEAVEDEIHTHLAQLHTAENEISKQSVELQTVKDKISSQSEELKTVRVKLCSQSEELRTVRVKISSQSEELKTVRDMINSQSAEIQSLSDTHLKNKELEKKHEELEKDCQHEMSELKKQMEEVETHVSPGRTGSWTPTSEGG